MEENKPAQETHTEMQDNNNRRSQERRAGNCEGYTYVSTVGWICRREKCRRKNQDDMPSTSSEV